MNLLSASLVVLWSVASTACAQTATPEPTGAAERDSNEQMPETLFRELDKNRDGVITNDEIVGPNRTRYGAALKRADRDGDGRVTREEFAAARYLPLYRDIRTLAALLLILAFACFCLFVDGLLEPERRDYFWSSLGAAAVLVALAYLCASGWFFTEAPFLAYVAVAPALLIVVAILTGATHEKEKAPTATAGPVVYKVGAKPAAAGSPAQRAGATPRRVPPQRTPRPAPLPRPPVPERRPPPTSSAPSPRSSASASTQPARPPASPAPQPPRTQPPPGAPGATGAASATPPPRPSGPTPRPGGPQPPPKKT